MKEHATTLVGKTTIKEHDLGKQKISDVEFKLYFYKKFVSGKGVGQEIWGFTGEK